MFTTNCIPGAIKVTFVYVFETWYMPLHPTICLEISLQRLHVHGTIVSFPVHAIIIIIHIRANNVNSLVYCNIHNFVSLEWNENHIANDVK